MGMFGWQQAPERQRQLPGCEHACRCHLGATLWCGRMMPPARSPSSLPATPTCSPMLAVCDILSPGLEPQRHPNADIQCSPRTTPPGLITYVLAQLGVCEEASRSVHASRPLKSGKVAILYQGHVISSDDETAFEKSVPPVGVRHHPPANCPRRPRSSQNISGTGQPPGTASCHQPTEDRSPASVHVQRPRTTPSDAHPCVTLGAMGGHELQGGNGGRSVSSSDVGCGVQATCAYSYSEQIPVGKGEMAEILLSSPCASAPPPALCIMCLLIAATVALCHSVALS